MVDVRPATRADVPGIRRVARASWHAAYGPVLENATIEERLGEWYSESVLERAVTADSVVYLVAEDEDVVGYASGSDGEEWEPDAATLSSIYVDPDRWKEGIGGQLLAALCDRLRERGFERLRAVVLAENDVGLDFYEREGFEQVEERTEELGDTEREEVVVERSL